MAVTTLKGAIGIQDVVYATLNESTDVASGTPTYGTVTSLAGGMKFDVKKNAGLTTLYADDKAALTASYQGKTQVAVELYDVNPASYAAILGASYANGIVSESPLDASPYVAVGYKILYYANATQYYKYVWLLKGRFSKPDEGGETKKDTINFQSMTLNAEFVDLIANGKRENWIRTDDDAASATTITNWFNQPVISNSVDLGALTLTSAAGTISTKTFVLTFAKAGGGTTTIANASASNVIISVGSTGSQIALTTFTPGSASTTPTLSVVTSSTLTGVPYTVCVTGDLKDANGVPVTLKTVTCTPA